MISIGIVEDNIVDYENLYSLIMEYSEANNYSIECKYYSAGEEYLSCRNRHDLLFMDMELGGINGIETSKIIRQTDPEVSLVIVTSLIQYAIQGYSVKATDYLLKPLEYEMFSRKMDEFMANIRRKKNCIMLKTERGLSRWKNNEVAYLEVFGHQLYMVGKNGRERVNSTLSKMEQMLVPYGFAKCNKCYLVNLAMVDGIYGDNVEVAGNLLKMSRREKTIFMQKLTRMSEV